MNPLIGTLNKIAISLALWMALGLIASIGLWYWSQLTFQQLIVTTLPLSISLHAMSASAYYVSLQFRVTERSLFKAIGFTLIYAGLAGIMLVALQHSFALANEALFNIPSLNTQFQFIDLAVFTLGLLVYAFSLISYEAIIATHSLKNLKQKEAAQELWAKHAELKALRSQINPHFLFNSLNSISALTSISPEKTRAMIIELSQFYRESLSVSDLTEIPVSRELAICQHFIAIESIRYGNKLQLVTEVSPEALIELVPPLCLQPLLENAIKHGISRLKAAAPICLQIKLQHNNLYIVISNQIPTDQITGDKPEGTSTGLKNLRSRLALLYGEKALCNWAIEQNFYKVELVFPKQSKEGY